MLIVDTIIILMPIMRFWNVWESVEVLGSVVGLVVLYNVVIGVWL